MTYNNIDILTENYEKYGRLLNLDMVAHPEIALRPDVSLVVIVHGMAKGSFTGKKLGDYITDFDHRVYPIECPSERPR